MAIYHASAKIISRSGGKSILASAAYRAGDQLTDERLGKSFDYTKKSGVDSTIILAPTNAPDWVNNREKLWNKVEAAEKRFDSQLAREFNIALPIELTPEQMKDLAKSYVQEQFVDRGMIADVAFHDLNSDNPHFHVLLTMRDLTEQGFGLKNRDWNSKDLLVEHREAWATHVNAALEEIGRVEEKIDHRTLVAQGITDHIAQVHLGPLLHRIREEYLEEGDLQGFRDKYQIGDLYETISEINRELATSNVALEELEELIAIEQEAMEEIKQQTTSLQEAQNRAISQTEEESNRERERESTAESINLTKRLQGITDYFTSSSREAEASRRRLHSLADRLRGSGGEVGKDREPSQSIGDSTAAEIQPNTEPSRNSQKPTQGLEKGTGSRPQSSAAESIEQSEQNQQQLSSDLGSRAEGQEAISRTTEPARSPHTAETGGSNPNPDGSAQLGLGQELSPQRQLNRTDQGTGEQHRNQAQPNGEGEKSLSEQQRLASLQNLAVIATIIRLMEDLDEETFEGQRYRLKVSTNYKIVQMYALDGRGLILQKKDGQIRGQLSDEDLQAIEHLNQQLDRREGQRQVNRCMPVLALLLNYLGQDRQDNSVYFLELDSKTQIMTYRSLENPEDFLVAKQTEQGWKYNSGKLSPDHELEISVDLDQWLEQQAQIREKEPKKERGRGFSR